MHRRFTRLAARAAVLTLAVGCAVVASMPPDRVEAAGASLSLAANLVSSTQVDATGCGPTTIAFGMIEPGTSYTTPADCLISFGSTNATAQLQMQQQDAFGTAMWKPGIGALDTGFDGDGVKNIPGASGARADSSYAMDRQPDGKLVIGGECYMSATNEDFCVERLNRDGTLDTTFSGDGIATAAATDLLNGYDYIRDLVVAPDGTITGTGHCDSLTHGSDTCLVRFNANGTLDTSFAGDGTLLQPIASGANTDFSYAVAVQPDGKTLVGGICYGAVQDSCISRLNRDGSLDLTFNGTGTAIRAIGNPTRGSRFNIIKLLPNGKILAAGYCAPTTNFDFCVARMNPDGSLDTSFDSDGVASVAFSAATDMAHDLTVQPDGKLLLVGECNVAATGVDFCAARLNADGSPDLTFNGVGYMSTPVAAGAASDIGYAGFVESDGKIVMAGTCDLSPTAGCLVRLRSDGTLDTSFGTGGMQTTSIGSGADQFRRVMPWDDGSYIASGLCDMGGATGTDMCVAVYGGGTTIANYASGTHDWATVGSDLFAVCLRAVGGSTAGDWTLDATCPTTDGAYWHAAPIAMTTVAHATSSGVVGATASFRFGMRAAVNTPSGNYSAPITFTTIAP